MWSDPSSDETLYQQNLELAAQISALQTSVNQLSLQVRQLHNLISILGLFSVLQLLRVRWS